ncbi:conserved hypothetical protein [Neospora caninum Liverpool]|nr:conserved hypothetical protein [Neospora caninum Liverpool]CBZ55202.1 conserved hypothetical protein [Neospora caninum Liverpool]|eukprot:XP_003885230.1 conserved hypothetical protein [Neospora caninum Liverpool]
MSGRERRVNGVRSARVVPGAPRGASRRSRTGGVMDHKAPSHSCRAVVAQRGGFQASRTSPCACRTDEANEEHSAQDRPSAHPPRIPLPFLHPLSPRLPPAASSDVHGREDGVAAGPGDAALSGMSPEGFEKCVFHVSRTSRREGREDSERRHARCARFEPSLTPAQGAPSVPREETAGAEKAQRRPGEARRRLREGQVTREERRSEGQVYIPAGIGPREKRKGLNEARADAAGDQRRSEMQGESVASQGSNWGIPEVCASRHNRTHGEPESTQDAGAVKATGAHFFLPVSAAGTLTGDTPRGVSVHLAPFAVSWSGDGDLSLPLRVETPTRNGRKAKLETDAVPRLQLSRVAGDCVGASRVNRPWAPLRGRAPTRHGNLRNGTTTKTKEKREARAKRHEGDERQTGRERSDEDETGEQREALQDACSVVSSLFDDPESCASLPRRDGEPREASPSRSSSRSPQSLSACLEVASFPSEDEDAVDSQLASYASADCLELSEHPLAWGVSPHGDSAKTRFTVTPSASRRRRDTLSSESVSGDTGRRNAASLSFFSSRRKRAASSRLVWGCVEETTEIVEGFSGEETGDTENKGDGGDAFPPLASAACRHIKIHKRRASWTEVHTVGGDEAWATERRSTERGATERERQRKEVRGASTARRRNACAELLKAIGLSAVFSRPSEVSSPQTENGGQRRTTSRVQNGRLRDASGNGKESSVWWDEEERSAAGPKLSETNASVAPHLSSLRSTCEGVHEGRSVQRREQARTTSLSAPSFSTVSSGSDASSRSEARDERAVGPRRRGSRFCRFSRSPACSSPRSSVIYPVRPTRSSSLSGELSPCASPEAAPGDCRTPVVYVAWWPTAPEHLLSVFEKGVSRVSSAPRGWSSETSDGRAAAAGRTSEAEQSEILRRQLATLRLDGIQYVLRDGSGLACLVGFFTERHRDVFLSYYGSTEPVGSMRRPPRWLCDICLASVLALSSLSASDAVLETAPGRRRGRPHGEREGEDPRETERSPASCLRVSRARDGSRPLSPSEARPHATGLARRAWQILRRSGFEDVIMAPASLVSEAAALMTPAGSPVEDAHGTGVTLAPPCLGVFLSWLPFAVWAGGQRQACAFVNERLQRLFHFKCRRMQFLPSGGAQLEFDSPAYAARFMKRYGGLRESLRTQRFIDHFFPTLDLFVNPTERLTAPLFIFQLATYPLLSALPSLASVPADPRLCGPGPAEPRAASRSSRSSPGEETPEDTASERRAAEHTGAGRRERRFGKTATAFEETAPAGEKERGELENGGVREGGGATPTQKARTKKTRKRATHTAEARGEEKVEGKGEREKGRKGGNGSCGTGGSQYTDETETKERLRMEKGGDVSSFLEWERHKGNSQPGTQDWMLHGDANGTGTRQRPAASAERAGQKLSSSTSGLSLSGSPFQLASPLCGPSSPGGHWWGCEAEWGEPANARSVSSSLAGPGFDALPPSANSETDAATDAPQVDPAARWNGRTASSRVSCGVKRRRNRNCPSRLALRSSSVSASSYFSLSPPSSP